MLKFIEKFETMRADSLEPLICNQTAKRFAIILFSFSRDVRAEFDG